MALFMFLVTFTFTYKCMCIFNQYLLYATYVGIIYNRQFIYFQFPVIHEKLNGHEGKVARENVPTIGSVMHVFNILFGPTTVVELLKKRIIINCDTFKQTTALSYSHESSIDKIEPFIYLMFPSSSNGMYKLLSNWCFY